MSHLNCQYRLVEEGIRPNEIEYKGWDLKGIDVNGRDGAIIFRS